MSGRQVVAAGLLIFRRFNNEIQYLLLQHSYGPKHWTPPKGHVDPGESEYEAAVRETEEEAGVHRDQLRIIKEENFLTVLHYNVRENQKRVVYWLSEMKDAESAIRLSSEHVDYRWLSLKDAIDLVGFKDMQEALIQADAYIRQNEK